MGGSSNVQSPVQASGKGASQAPQTQQSSYGQSNYGQPAGYYGQTGYGQSDYGQSNYGMPNFGYQQAPQASGKGASPFQNAYTPQYGGYEQPQTAQYQQPQEQYYQQTQQASRSLADPSQQQQYQPPQPQAYEPPQPEQRQQQAEPQRPTQEAQVLPQQYQPQEQPQQQPEPPRNPALTVAQQAVEQQQAVAPGTNGSGLPPANPNFDQSNADTFQPRQAVEQYQQQTQAMQNATGKGAQGVGQGSQQGMDAAPQASNGAQIPQNVLDRYNQENQGQPQQGQPSQLDPAMRAAQQAQDQATAAFNRGEISPQQMLEAQIKAGSAFGQNYSQAEQDQMLQNMTLGQEQQKKYNDAMASGMTPQQWNEQQDRAAATAQGLSEEQFQQMRAVRQAQEQYSPFSQLDMLSNIQNGAGVLGGSQQGLGQLGAINQGQANQLGRLGQLGAGFLGGSQQGVGVIGQAPETYTGTGQPIAAGTGPNALADAYRDDTFPSAQRSQDAAMQAAQQAQAEASPSQQTNADKISDMFNQFRQQHARSATGKGVSGAPQTMGMDESVYAKRGGAIGHYADGGDVVAPGMSLLMMEKK